MKIFVFIFLLFTANVFASQNFNDKSTQRLKNKISALANSNNEIISVWLTIETSVNKIPVILSDESLQRRKKVDPINYLINSSDSTFSQALLDSLIGVGAEIRHQLYWFNAVTINISTENISKLGSLPFVKELDVVQKLTAQKIIHISPDQETKEVVNKSMAHQYGASLFQNQFMKSDKLHDIGLSGKGIRIAMFDTGFNTNHPAFDSLNIINTYNFIDNISDVTQIDCTDNSSQSHHGTMTLGVIGGYVPDILIGVAYNAEFLLAKTEITCNGTEIYQEEDNWIAAAQWADLHGADIISSSLGYLTFQDSAGYTFADLDGDTPRITAAADIAASKNILVINSAGNERGSPWGRIITPADGDSVIAVGATNPDFSIANFSSPGPSADGRIKPDISTLGVSIVTSVYTGGYTSGVNGTSFSAPLVSGAAALALEHDTTLTADELRDLIRQSGDRFEAPDNDFGYGLFDAVKTANIVSFLKPHSIHLSGESENQFLIETSGRSGVTPTLQIIDTIAGITFTDNTDGTGYLEIISQELNLSFQVVRLVADVGYFADTTEFSILASHLVQNKLAVGPNPFSDSLNIYFYDPSNFEGITIFSVSGEKVWELFNKDNIDADNLRIERTWNCINQSGAVVADGVYIVVISAGGTQFHKKVLKIE